MTPDQARTLIAALTYQNRPSMVAFAKEKLTVTGVTAQTLTPPETALYCEIKVETSVASPAVRYWNTGDVPTTTDGEPLSDGTKFDITNADNIAKFKVIATSGTTNLWVQYYK